jgi:bacterioferritin-associated ferredoxin
MDRIATNIERRMFIHESLQKWEILIWLDQKIKQAQEQAEVASFEEIIEKLPLSIMLAFDSIHYRSAIYKITDTTLERIAKGGSARLQQEIIFDREKMSSPLRDFVEGEKNNLYIENASLDPRTSYMSKLIRDANINDIYFTKVETSLGVWAIVVEGIYPQKIDEEKKDFLAVLCNRIRKIELERAEILARIGKEIIETQIGTIAYLLNLLAHLFRNKITAMGGLCRIIDKIAVTGNNGDCGKCSEKTQNVLKEAREIEQILTQFDLALADLNKATVINVEPIPLPRLIDEIQAEDPSSDFKMELEDSLTDFALLTDRRKTVKAICRMVKKITQDNKSPIVVGARRIDREKIKMTLKQREMNTENLARLVNIRENGDVKDHSLSDFVVIISCCLLPELGINIEIGQNVVEFAFRVPMSWGQDGFTEPLCQQN